MRENLKNSVFMYVQTLRNLENKVIVGLSNKNYSLLGTTSLFTNCEEIISDNQSGLDLCILLVILLGTKNNMYDLTQSTRI